MFTAFDRLEAQARQWRVTVNETRGTVGSVIGLGERRGSAVVLKVIRDQGDEWHSGEVLRAFQGCGTVRVLESVPGAILMERLEPGESLVNLVRQQQDEDATEILAEVMRQMAGHTAPVGCPTVEDWSRSFDRYLTSPNKQIPRELVCEARDVYQDLMASPRTQMLLHGDLQHYNVLSDKNRGWIAIDPKGVVGELEYEVGAILRNPTELPDLFTSRVVIERRIEVLAKRLPLNYERMISWAFAQAVLSAIWDVQDGYPIEPENGAVKLAKVLTSIC